MNEKFKMEYVNAVFNLEKQWCWFSYYGLTGAGVGVGIVFGSLVFGLSRNLMKRLVFSNMQCLVSH